MKKLLLTCAAVAGLSMALSASVFADNVVTNDTYDADTNKVSVKTDLSSYNGQMTVIVIPAAAYEANEITDEDIIYINQDAAGEDIFQNMGLLGESLDEGDYYIKVGGENIAADGIIVEKFTVGSSGQVYLYGDVDGSEDVTDDDAMEILYYYNYMDSVFDDGAEWRFVAGDVDDSGDVTDDDAMEILYYYNYMDSVFDTMDPTTFEM